jgi:lipopolysaccharide heptosyltransferase I
MKRILVIKLSSLGDLAHALPAVRALKRRTGAEIDWVTQPEYVPLLECCPDVNRILAFPRRNVIRQGAAFLWSLRREKYDAIVDLQGLMKSALVARLARGKRRVGPAWAREGSHYIYQDQPARPEGPRRHAVEELMDVVDLVMPGDTVPEELNLQFPEAEADGRPGPHIALAPFSRWATKDWPVEKFVEVARRLASEMGGQIRIIGGPDHVSQGNSMARQIGPAAKNLCGKTDLIGLCSLLKGMDLLITVDSGPMHWADAMGVPLVAIFGATDPARTGPYHQRNHVVTQQGLACQPCHSRSCARKDLACLTTLESDVVLQAALARL